MAARDSLAGYRDRAAEIASTYRILITPDAHDGFVGESIELPLHVGVGPTLEACFADTLSVLTTGVAYMLSRGEVPPAPSRDGTRAQQVNIRLSADEKFRLEDAAHRAGYRSLSDFMRAAAMREAAATIAPARTRL